MELLQTENYSPSTTFTLQELRIELLRACPLLCVHCSAHAAPLHALHLPLRRILTLVDEFADGGGQRITLTGGEPFLYIGIDNIVQHCQQRGLRVRIFSSGVILVDNKHTIADEKLQQLAPAITTIIYSLYAACPTTHDLVTRVPGSFALTLQAIERSISLGIGTELHFVPTMVNYQELPSIVELANASQVSRVSILRFVPHGRGKTRAADLSLNDEAHNWLRRTIITLRRQYPHIKLNLGSAYNLLHIEQVSPCTAGIQQLVIEANGDIVPCSAFSNIHVKDDYGNIVQHSLQTVWEKSRYLHQVRQSLATQPNCNSCIAQRAIPTGRVDILDKDPLENVLFS